MLQHANADKKTSVRLLQERALTPVLTPIIFSLKAPALEASEETVQYNLAINPDDVIGDYARTAEYADSLTAYFPALISWLIKRKLNGRQISYEEGERFVRAVYYNLRVYLGQDHFKARLFARDKTIYRRLKVRGHRAGCARENHFDTEAETIMRYRRQPTALFRKESLRSGALI